MNTARTKEWIDIRSKAKSCSGAELCLAPKIIQKEEEKRRKCDFIMSGFSVKTNKGPHTLGCVKIQEIFQKMLDSRSFLSLYYIGQVRAYALLEVGQKTIMINEEWRRKGVVPTDYTRDIFSVV